ncbi:MAG: hypothetical protein WAN35_18680 [Terracidiphilus sp.]
MLNLLYELRKGSGEEFCGGESFNIEPTTSVILPHIDMDEKNGEYPEEWEPHTFRRPYPGPPLWSSERKNHNTPSVFATNYFADDMGRISRGSQEIRSI